MVHPCRPNQRTRYGPDSSRERHNARGDPSAIQHSQESLRGLAKRYGVNQKTIAKWRGRTSVTDLPTGPKEPKSTVLSIEEEAIVVAFRRHTLLPLDDCLYSLQATVLASAIHSITSSALASSAGGAERPSASAVFRLIVILNFDGVCTGKSEGFSPRKMRSI
jgi:hypothetical protein